MPETVLGQCDSALGAGLVLEIGLMIFVTQYQGIKHIQNLSNVRNIGKCLFLFTFPSLNSIGNGIILYNGQLFYRLPRARMPH